MQGIREQKVSHRYENDFRGDSGTGPDAFNLYTQEFLFKNESDKAPIAFDEEIKNQKKENKSDTSALKKMDEDVKLEEFDSIMKSRHGAMKNKLKQLQLSPFVGKEDSIH